jgi:hypothetical protein
LAVIVYPARQPSTPFHRSSAGSYQLAREDRADPGHCLDGQGRRPIHRVVEAGEESVQGHRVVRDGARQSSRNEGED